MKEKDWLPTEKNIEEHDLLKSMLISQRNEYDLLSKKKPDGQLNIMKIKMLNRVLVPLKDLLIHQDSNEFLDIVSEEEMPTYSDVVLIIGQYEAALKKFREKYFFTESKSDLLDSEIFSPPSYRWMTKENPPDDHKSK